MPAVKYWSNLKDCRLNQKPRKKCKPRQSKSHNIYTKPDLDNEYKSEKEIELLSGANEFMAEL